MKKFFEKLRDSPICYFSDLFVAAMVVGWMVTGIVMMAAAVYATVALADTSIWGNVAELVTIPLSAGGALWMLKNSVQHAIMNRQGKTLQPDFPAVHPDGEEETIETEATEDENTQTETDQS